MPVTCDIQSPAEYAEGSGPCFGNSPDTVSAFTVGLASLAYTARKK